MSEAKESPLEAIKRESLQLRGSIPAELVNDSDHFSKDAGQLLKHHGTYEQDDRDQRKAARAAGLGKQYIYMVRTRIPGGRLTSTQLLAELDLCDELANQTLRITSRQGLQFHGIVKGNLREVIRRVNQVQLTTLGACGDVNRNVMCCPLPLNSAPHRQVQDFAQRLADHFAPATPAYREIWLREEGAEHGERVAGGPPEVDPIYGAAYLPRKFKMGIAFPDDNCIDVFTHDIGWVAIVEQGELIGFDVLVGGGLGVTPSNAKTFPALGVRLAFVPLEQAIAVAEAIVRVQRDFGDRSDRKVARLKYTVRRMGLEAFRAEVESRVDHPLQPARGVEVTQHQDHMGWTDQGDGRWCYGLNIENGRIHDTEHVRIKSALRAVCRELVPGVRLTAHQSILFTDIADEQRERLTSLLREHAVPLTEEISNARRWSMACVAWPTCGLSITESERALPAVIDALEAELASLGLDDEVMTIRMTGCPNGCARPYNCDVGLVGKAKDKYTVYVGGRVQGDRLNYVFKDMVPGESLAAELRVLFELFRDGREPGESFGDFCHREADRIRDLASAS